MPDQGSTAKSRRSKNCIAFDFGLRRIGVAVGNTVTRSAAPAGVIRAKDGEPDWAEIDAVIREWMPDVIVLGLPYNSARSESSIVPRLKEFAESLAKRHAIEITTVDEHLTSREAGDMLRRQRESGVRSKRLRKGDIDSVAAMLILETWLSENEPESGFE